jgi:hypothetical protein
MKKKEYSLKRNFMNTSIKLAKLLFKIISEVDLRNQKQF